MKKILLLLLLPLILAGCADNSAKISVIKNEVKEIKEKTVESPEYGVISTIPNFFAVAPELFKDLYDTGEMIVIDVRTPEEIAEGKIFPEALEINFYDSKFREKISKLDKNDKYLIYCRSGARSGKTLKIFKDLGFMEAYDLDGGKIAWDNYTPKETAEKYDQADFRVINIDAKRYEFLTTEIKVKQNEKVILKINNLDVTHGIQIEGLNQRDNDEIILDTSKKGAFPFSCNNLCGIGHSSMKGQIIIE